MADTLAALTDLQNRLKAASEKLAGDQKLLDENTALMNELRRQIAVHTSSGAVNDANIVSAQLNDVYITRSKLQANVADSQQNYEALQVSYDNTVRNLTPVQKAQVEAQNQAIVINAQAQKDNAAANLAKANYASTSVKYIIGAIVVVAVVGIVLYFKFRKKS